MAFPSTWPLAADVPYRAQADRATTRPMSFNVRLVANAAALLAAELAGLSVALGLAGIFTGAAQGVVSGSLASGGVVLLLYTFGGLILRLHPGYGLGIVEEVRRIAWSLAGSFSLVAMWQELQVSGVGAEALGGAVPMIAAGLLSLVLVPYARTKAKAGLIRYNRWGLPVAIYGGGRAGAFVVRQLQEERGMGYYPTVVLDDEPDRWGGFLDTVPVVRGVEEVTTQTAVAFLALPDAPAEQKRDLLEGPLSGFGTVIVIPDLFDAPSLWVRPRDLGGVLGLEIASNLAHPLARGLKRAIDLALVLGTAIVWAPLVLVLAGLVWLQDRHSPFFVHRRLGRDGRPFYALKLRTMIPDADKLLQDILGGDSDRCAEWELHFKLLSDPRVTRLGGMLRRTSLDELPQLVNVLRGEMSLVGPRPLPPYHQATLAPRTVALRETVAPGLTGLWQVAGRSDQGAHEMERWDAYYVRNGSLWLDVVILVRTVRAVFSRSGAY